MSARVKVDDEACHPRTPTEFRDRPCKPDAGGAARAAAQSYRVRVLGRIARTARRSKRLRVVSFVDDEPYGAAGARAPGCDEIAPVKARQPENQGCRRQHRPNGARRQR